MRTNQRLVPFSIVLLTCAAAFAAGCAVEDSQQVAAQAVARVRPNWKLQLDWAGGKVELPTEGMDIYLVEDENQYPEVFEILGDDLALVGDFPMDVHVGYGEEYERLVGKTITIVASGGDPRDPKNSFVRIQGAHVPVSGGTFTVQKVTGKWSGSEGDKTLWGTVELQIPGASGEQTVHGKFAVHTVTWG